MKKMKNIIVMTALVAVIMITSTVFLRLSGKLPGTLSDSVMALEAGIDAGNWTEEDVLNEIYGGALNDPHGIGRLLYQGYLTQYVYSDAIVHPFRKFRAPQYIRTYICFGCVKYIWKSNFCKGRYRTAKRLCP